MNGRRVWSSILVVALAATGARLWFGEGSVEGREAVTDGEGLASAPHAPHAPLETENEEPKGAEPRHQAERSFEEGPELLVAPVGGTSDARRRAAAAVELRVRDSAGGAIVGAWVSWSPLDLAPTDTATERDWRELLESTTAGATDTAGRWTLDELPAHARGGESVLWVTAPGYEATFLIVAPRPPGAGSLDRELVLTPAPGTPVRVVGPDGVGLQGAEVLLTGADLGELRHLEPGHPLAGPGSEVEAELARALRSFVRLATSGQEGALELPATPRPCLALARLSSLVSPRRATNGAEPVELLLGGEVLVEGELQLLEEVDAPPGPDVFVDVWHHDSGHRTLLASLELQPNWTFGPSRAPARSEGRYRFQVRCLRSSIEAAWRERPCRGPGETLRISLSGALTRPQEVHVVDPDGAPLEGARVTLRWTHGRGEQTLEAFTDEEGVAWLRSPPGDYCDFTATSPGRAARTLFAQYSPWPEPRVLELAPGGRLRARVRHEGEVVRRFRLHAWTDDARRPRVLTPRLEADGSFLLDDLPLQELHLRAAGVEFGESETLTATPLREGPPPEVVLDLATGRTGFGVVLDASSGRPIPGAEVLVEDRLQQPGGQPEVILGARPGGAVTGTDGRFELRGLPEVRANLVIEAHGYARARVEQPALGEGPTDLGAIQLVPPQDLLVRYEGTAPFDPQVHWLQGSGPIDIPLQLFDSEGQALIRELAPGRYDLQIIEQDTLTQGLGVQLRAGEPWEVRFDHLPSRTLDIEVRPADGEPLPDSLICLLSTKTSKGHPLQVRKQVQPDGTCALRHVVDGPAVITVVDPGVGAVLASRPVTVSTDRSDPIVVPLQGRELLVHAESPDGEALSVGVALVVTDDEAMPWHTRAGLDSEGNARLRGVPSTSAMLCVVHPDLGVALQEVHLDDEGTTEATIVVGGGQALEVRVVDGSGPVEGVGLSFQPTSTIHATDSTTTGRTGASGSYRHPGLPPVELRLTAERAGYWSHREQLDLAGQAGHEVHLRRPGELVTLVYGPDGLPAAGARLALRSVQYGETVSGWVDAGRLAANRVRLVADATGRCEVRGLPCGPYDWEVRYPDGSTSTGRLEVVEAARAPITLTAGG